MRIISLAIAKTIQLINLIPINMSEVALPFNQTAATPEIWSLVGPWISGVISKLGGGISLFLYLVFTPAPTATDEMEFAGSNTYESEAVAQDTLVATKGNKRRIEVHHIVAQRAPHAGIARIILLKHEIGVNSANNLVPLSYEFHRHLHSDAYYGFVNAKIVKADRKYTDPVRYKMNVTSSLLELKAMLHGLNLGLFWSF